MRDVARGDIKQGRLDHLAKPPRDYRPERFAIGYGGQHDDCIATIPHYHDRPYKSGDWSDIVGEEDVAAIDAALAARLQEDAAGGETTDG